MVKVPGNGLRVVLVAMVRRRVRVRQRSQNDQIMVAFVERIFDARRVSYIFHLKNGSGILSKSDSFLFETLEDLRQK